MSEHNPIRVFVTHMFGEHPDYSRVFDYLESDSNFFYVNCSNPDDVPAAGGKDALKARLLEQIRAAEVVLVVGSMYLENRDLIEYQLTAAATAELPVVGLEPFGGTGEMPEEIAARCNEVVGWNERLMVDALRREARQEETTRWDVIEFDLS